MDTQNPFQAWTQALQNASQSSANPMAANPMAAARFFWVDFPVEVATRLQRFTAERMQDQMRLLAELGAQEGNVNPFMREAAFLQQSSVAWGAEVMQIMELCQERLLNTSRADSEAPIHYPKAA